MSRSHRWIIGSLRALVGVFFREVVVSGEDNVPTDRGGVLVAWHPNGLLDPGLIVTTFTPLRATRLRRASR